MLVTINEFKEYCKLKRYHFDFAYGKKNQIYINIPCSFDIETTSLYKNIKENTYISNKGFYKTVDKKERKYYQKIAFMYVWQLAIFDYEIIGRTWNEFIELLQFIKKILFLEQDRKHLIIYVHNLSYEFQFLKDWLSFYDVFALSERKPIKAICTLGIEFRCSYLLSGYSLAKLAENLETHKIEKLMGDLDYELIRHSKTPLTKDELNYCINDILIVKYYIEECINRFGTIADIPLTQTGIVRKYVREYTKKTRGYFRMIHNQKMSVDEFKIAKRCFSGGFTHANIKYVGETVKDVTSIDFTSSYPFVLLSEKYPMSTGIAIKKPITKKLFNDLLKDNLAIFDIVLTDVKTKYNINIISYHKCNETKNVKIDNGKIISADMLSISVTNIDFEDIKKFYDFSSCKIFNLHIYKKDYLPKSFLECVLKFYNDKTQLKGVEDKEVEYLHSKEMLNSLYGMCVTNIIRDNIVFNGKKWERVNCNVDEQVNYYNKDSKRFLNYLWGVFCTSYARHNLYSGILEFLDDYIYCDTDSIKCINFDKHKKYIEKYNNECEKKLQECFNYHNLDYSLYKPKTIKGVEKIIGVWDLDGKYKLFKTLGAKRYIYTDNENNLHVTISGLNKNINKYFLDSYKTIESVFDNFENGLYIERGYSGKKTHTYIDGKIKGELIDYQNNKGSYNEKSFIHLEDCEFLLSMSDDFLQYILMYPKLIDKNKYL